MSPLPPQLMFLIAKHLATNGEVSAISTLIGDFFSITFLSFLFWQCVFFTGSRHAWLTILTRPDLLHLRFESIMQYRVIGQEMSAMTSRVE